MERGRGQKGRRGEEEKRVSDASRLIHTHIGIKHISLNAAFINDLCKIP